MKALYFDVETTGLDANTAGLTQIAAILVIDGEEIDSFNFDINPYTYPTKVDISEDALRVTNKTVAMLKSYPDQKEQFNNFISFLDKHVNKYDKNDKLTPVGYNVAFDMKFLQAWFKANNHSFFGSYIHYKDVDVFALAKLFQFVGAVDLPNHKLGTMCEHYGIDLGDAAHDALADIRATRELLRVMVDKHVKL